MTRAVEMLRVEPETYRATAWMRALVWEADAAGIPLRVTGTYHGLAPWLVLWGPGEPTRAAAMRRHVAGGGRAVCFDLAYWRRESKVRVSIDAAHPQDVVMRKDWPSTRLQGDGVRLWDRWAPDGPIVVAGIGRKARIQYGDRVRQWEADMIAACRRRWPRRSIWYRPKQADAPVPPGAIVVRDSLVENVIVDASLVVTWHSNVAVDAIRMGVPVICRDGAAAAVCPSTLTEEDPQPLDEALRRRFLANLAWFQWAVPEARACWAFLREMDAVLESDQTRSLREGCESVPAISGRE